MADREATLALTRDVTHVSAGDPRPGVVYDDAKSNHSVDPELGLPMDKLLWLQDQLIAMGNLANPVDLTRVVDTQPRDEALALLRKQERTK